MVSAEPCLSNRGHSSRSRLSGHRLQRVYYIEVRIFALILACLAALSTASCYHGSKPSEIGKAAPDFTIRDSDHSVTLSQYRGKIVVLNFWATWCPPCVDDVPSIEDMARTIDGTDMRLLAVSVDDDWNAIRRFFVKGTKIGVLLDTSHNVPKTFGTEKYPETFFVDAQGRVRYYFINKRNWSKPEAVACLESLR